MPRERPLNSLLQTFVPFKRSNKHHLVQKIAPNHWSEFFVSPNELMQLTVRAAPQPSPNKFSNALAHLFWVADVVKTAQSVNDRIRRPFMKRDGCLAEITDAVWPQQFLGSSARRLFWFWLILVGLDLTYSARPDLRPSG
jgi:hypothetical protein